MRTETCSCYTPAGNRSTKVPRGVVEDVLVLVGKFLFHINFIVLDTQSVANMTNKIHVILGWPFLATSNVVIHCQSGELELFFGNFKVTLNVFNIENHPPDIDDVGSIDIIESLESDSLTPSNDPWRHV